MDGDFWKDYVSGGFGTVSGSILTYTTDTKLGSHGGLFNGGALLAANPGLLNGAQSASFSCWLRLKQA